jgi:hypothetical protein
VSSEVASIRSKLSISASKMPERAINLLQYSIDMREVGICGVRRDDASGARGFEVSRGKHNAALIASVCTAQGVSARRRRRT